MNYEGILEFKGTWRNYQARVLEHADRYMADGKIHIVAAPGSGKTTLGIELIRRMNGKALILAPSITIREQWIARIEEAFLCEGVQGEDFLSQNLKQPKAITVATYQALHSAMTRFQGMQEDAGEVSGTDECLTENETEEVDYSGFDLVAAMKEAGIEVLCLDECHHLRSEWWKALEEFKKQVDNLKIIALTATPPYDSTPAMWTRYMNMCGEIDEEITIPELVKEGSLCPHQDYVYFNYPTKEEEQEVRRFEERSKAMTEKLMQDTQFFTYVRSHKGLSGQLSDDLLLDNPAYLASLLIYLQSKNVAFPSRLQRLLGAKKLPSMNVQWMERLLQGFLYDDVDSYLCDKVYRELLIADLKSSGLIEKKKVVMTKSAAVEKMLTNSLGKSNSIRDIVFHEYETSGQNLRLLVLTDYIRKEYEKAIGNTEYDVNSLGVLPFFEMLRRDNEKKNETGGFLAHSAQEDIIKMAKTSQVGTFQTALEIYAEQNGFQHDAVSGGFVQAGEGNVTALFPEYQEVRPGAPELITNDQGWISNVMRKVHKSPISRIRTSQTDIRGIDSLRARGYKKGKEKKRAGNFKLVRRTTDPQTVYVKNALHRDDIVDITDFDYVKYLYDIDRLMLNEELAIAMMLGDGREDGDEGKIDPDKIRPIWTDDDLYTIHADLDVEAAKKELQGTNTGANFGENYILAEAMINAVLYARENYKGTGTPDMYITPHMLNVMLLARDMNGRRIYSSKAELASAFNVGEILTAEQFEGKTRKTDDSKTKKLLAIITNLNDYSLGATKGGEVTHFTQFDIDFNQEKSLLETRCSGALTRVYSAIAIEEDVTDLP